MAEPKLMNTIDGTYSRAKAENLGVSKNFIRQSVLNGALPSIRAGIKYLINYEKFLAFLNTPQPIIPQEQQKSKVRQVVEKGKYNFESSFIPPE